MLSFKTDKLDASGNTSYYTQAIDATLAGKINGAATDGSMGADVSLAAGTYALTTTSTAGVIKLEADANGVETLSISDVVVTRGTHTPVAVTDIISSTNANSALGVLDLAIGNVNETRAGLGASMSRLEYASDNLQNVPQNTASARSGVMDADYASETTELARTQIIQQASTAMLSQANQSQQAVLALLK